MKSCRKGEDGFAMLVVLVAIFILSALVVPFHFGSRVQVRLVSRQAEIEQTRIAAASGVTVGRHLLGQDSRDVDSLTDVWALPLELDRDGIHWSVRIEDEGGTLALGGWAELTEPEIARRQAELVRLMRELDHPDNFAAALADWLDKDDLTRPGGAENLFYLPLGYSCRNGTPDTIFEIYRVRGAKAASSEDQPSWETYLSARETAEVNVNTAPAHVLLALSDKMDRQLVATVVDRRNRKPFERVSDLHDVSGFNEDIYAEVFDRLTVASDRFRIHSQAEVNGTTKTVLAEVERQGDKTRLLSWSRQ